VSEIGDLTNSGVCRVNTQVFGVKRREMQGHEAAKWREAVSHPSEEDRWQRSKDLVNLEDRRVRTKTLDTLSHEYASSEKEDKR
jgi:hypothetical protein